MKILLGLIATLSIALVPAPAETAKERAHEKVVAEAPPTDSSEQLAAQQIDKSYSSLKAALAGMIDSRKKGDLNAFALYKQQAIDAAQPVEQAGVTSHQHRSCREGERDQIRHDTNSDPHADSGGHGNPNA